MDAAGDPRNFSVVLGGPLYQLLRRAHLEDEEPTTLLRRRVAFFALVAWLPLLVLAVAAGVAVDGVAVPFLKDAQAHARFLVAIPLLVAAELLVHVRLRPVAQEFLVRGLVPPEHLERFHECVRSAFRLRNSVAAELAMLALIYGVGVPFVWRYFSALDVATWYAVPDGAGARLTLPGYWYAWVSVPLFQFLMLRWYFRMAIWIRFLWQVSRIPLRISAMHADLSGGLGFLSGTVFAFVPLLMAHGALLAGTVANRIFHAGGTLMASRVDIAVMVGLLLVLVLLPLAVFVPALSAAKRKASREYGRLAQRYATDFESRWLPGGAPAADTPLGTGDIQSLADLAGSFETIRAMKTFPVGKDAVIKLAVATLAPVAPLLLTVIPAEELFKRLLKLLI